VNVLKVISSFPPAYSYGGPLVVAYETAKKLVARGHSVTVLTTDVYDATSRLQYDRNPLQMDSINVYHFKNVSNKLARRNFGIAPSMAAYLDKHVKDFDFVHVYEYRSFQAVLVHHFAKKHRVPYIVQPNASTPRVVSKQKLKWLYDVTVGYAILRGATKVIAISKEERATDRGMGVEEDRLSLIYTGMDVEAFKHLPPRGTFRARHGVDGKMMLYLGRLNKSKGLHQLLVALSRLVKSLDGVTLVIAGPDEGCRAQLEDLVRELNIGDRVKFTGFVEEADKMAAYVDADLFVHPVKYMGGVGIAPLEAILCGTPVVVSEECAEIIKEANAGCVVKYGDIGHLVSALKYVLQERAEAQKMTERGTQFILNNLTWDKVVDRVEAVYDGCLARR